MDTRYIVLIPAYKPDERLIALCEALVAGGLPVLIVDDGSGPSHLGLFDRAQALGCAVLRHAVNLGKGRALKTGVNEAMNRFPALCGLITADADGQHTAADIRSVRDAMEKTPGALILGARRFTGSVPFKSRAGNAITKLVYRFVSGVRATDTQTGLRGIPAEAFAALLRLSGERYEYEMNMLLALPGLSLPVAEVEIETIYIDDNKGSHFRPFRDAARIYAVIFKFSLSSLLSFCVDYGLYVALLSFTGLPSYACYGVARVFSSLLNYAVNKAAVFSGRGGPQSIVRYYLLSAVQLGVGAGLVELFSGVFRLPATLVKVPIDLILFFFSFVIQRKFVF